MSKQIKHIIILCLGLIYFHSEGQIDVNNHQLQIVFDSIAKSLNITQNSVILYNKNSNSDTLYFYAWANAYQNKNTALATRFIENYDLNFHFTRKKNRGYLKIDKIKINNEQVSHYTFLKNHNDILRIVLPKNTKHKDSLNIMFQFEIKLPNSKFTGYGIDSNNNLALKHFYLTPALPSQLYSHKDLDDLPEKPTNFNIKLSNFSENKRVISELYLNNDVLIGKHVKSPILLINSKLYEQVSIGATQLIIYNNNPTISKFKKVKRLQKLMSFFEKEIGQYPYDQIIINQNDFRRNKVYGLDLLPKFINPFPNELVWEMKLLHQLSLKYANQMQIDKRKYPWILQGLSAYIEYQYYKKYYPNLKLIGNISKFKLVQFYYASQVKMIDKYPWLYLYMARMNKDQKLSMSLDSLSNFNRSVANPYKSALGFIMLKDEMSEGVFQQKIKDLYQYSLHNTISDNYFFKQFNIKNEHQWFTQYIYSRAKFDYKLKKLTIANDSLSIKIIKKEKGVIPSDIYGLRNDSIVWQKHFLPIINDTIVSVPKNLDMVGFNTYNNYPEIQTHNNFIKTHSLLGKSLQIRLYQDFENPKKRQVFINPYFEYNYYDGVQIGGQIMNESILHNNFNYSVIPIFGMKSKSLTGSFGVSYHHYFDHMKPYALLYGFNTKYYHYDHDLTYTRLNPYFVIKNRNKNIRKRQGSNLLFQYMVINKEVIQQKTEADSYQVINANYSYFDVNVIKDMFYKTDLQLSDKFGKLSAMFRYRFLSNKNRQWDFRIFAGYFLYNKTHTNYFSFALDRPTDYLFQYNYYGRSESSGIFHQQFVWAEGGFKTFFNDQFANKFIISNNLNIGIWKWFNLYGDWAVKKSKDTPAKFYFDSGMRINLVQDYFEAFFPIYSSLGNELTLPNYHQKIRLVFTINLQRAFSMVKRGWY